MRDPTDTRDIGPRVGSPLWIYLTAVTVAGGMVFALAVGYLVHPGLTHGRITLTGHSLFWVLAAIILAGEIWPVVTPGRSSLEAPLTSVTFSFAALLAWGVSIAVLLRATMTVVAFLGKRKAPHRAAFNAAASTLGLAAAGLVLLALHWPMRSNHIHHPGSDDIWKIFLAALTGFAVSYILITLAIALHSREPVLKTLVKTLPYQSRVHLVLYASAPLVALVIDNGSALLMALFAFPLGAIYVNAAISVQREHQAHHDELTGLANRKLLMRRLNETLAQAGSSGVKVGFLLLDLDRGLKEVNDTLGHAVGDRLLRLVAHRLTHSIRPGDLVAGSAVTSSRCCCRR